MRKLKPGEKICFKTKAEVVEVMRAYNPHLERHCTKDSSGASFETINHRLGLKGRRMVTSCGAAVRAVLPTTRPPYCLDELDLKTLNQIDPAKNGGGFRLPPAAQERIAAKQWQEHYSQLGRARKKRADHRRQSGRR